MGSGASSKCSDEQALGLLLAIAELGDGRTHGSAIPDGGTVRVTELAEFLRVGIKAHDDCPAMPDAVVSLISGTQGTVVQSKGNLVQIRHTVGVIWVPRMCVDHHAKERVRIMSDAALLKQVIEECAGTHPSLVSWKPGMEHIVGRDCDIIERQGVAVKLSPNPGQVLFLPEAVLEPIPDRCRQGLYPGQRLRASKIAKNQLDANPGLKKVFGDDGSKLAKVLGANGDGNPYIEGERVICTVARDLVVPLLQQGTEVQLSPEGLKNDRMRSFLKPGSRGLVCGFDDDGAPKVLVKGPSVKYAAQEFVVEAQGDSAPSASEKFKVGTRVLVHPKVSTPKYQWGRVSPGDVGVITGVSLGSGTYHIRFPQQQKWLGEGDELLAANFTGGSCGECQSTLLDATVRPQSWTCDQCKRSFEAPGVERWRCEVCDYDQCAICRKVPAQDSLVSRRVRCGDEQAQRPPPQMAVHSMRLDDEVKAALAGHMEAHGDAEAIDVAICLVCNNHLFGAAVRVTASCGHHFHPKCIKDAMKRNKTECPCSAAFPPGKEPVVEGDRMFKQLMCKNMVQCPQGCGKVLRFEAVHWHVHNDDGCPYTPFSCGNEGCGLIYPRKDMGAHLCTCPHRFVPCELCEELFKYGELQQHKAEGCPYRKVRCSRCQKEYVCCQKEEHMGGCTGAASLKNTVRAEENMTQRASKPAGSTTYQEFCDKLDRLDAAFDKKMEEQNEKFFADKPDESTLSPEMKEHYAKFERMIEEHTEKFSKKMREHSAHFKLKFQNLLEEQKRALFPGK